MNRHKLSRLVMEPPRDSGRFVAAITSLPAPIDLPPNYRGFFWLLQSDVEAKDPLNLMRFFPLSLLILLKRISHMQLGVWQQG